MVEQLIAEIEASEVILGIEIDEPGVLVGDQRVRVRFGVQIVAQAVRLSAGRLHAGGGGG